MKTSELLKLENFHVESKTLTCFDITYEWPPLMILSCMKCFNVKCWSNCFCDSLKSFLLQLHIFTFKLRLLIHLRFKAYSSAVAWKIEEKVFRSKVSPQSLQDTSKRFFSILTFTSSFLIILCWVLKMFKPKPFLVSHLFHLNLTMSHFMFWMLLGYDEKINHSGVLLLRLKVLMLLLKYFIRRLRLHYKMYLNIFVLYKIGSVFEYSWAKKRTT